MMRASSSVVHALGETACTLNKFLQVAEQIFHNFIELSNKLSFMNLSRFQLNIFKLPIQSILNLVAFRCHENFQVSVCNDCVLNAAENLFNLPPF